MTKPTPGRRVNRNPLPPLTPMSVDSSTPEPVPTIADLESQIRWFKNILAQERKSHGLAQKVLTRHVEQQATMIDDLRQMVIANTAAQLTPKEKS